MVEEAERLLGLRLLGPSRIAFDHAEAAGEDANRCSGGRWMAAMLAGDFAAAWRESDLLRARGAEDPHRFWDGKDLRGKRVIVRCLHGLGDAVQMLRYAPALAAMAGTVVWEVPPAMVELTRCFAGVSDVVTWGKGAPEVKPEWDSQVEVMELPYLFRTELASLPLAQRYCAVPLAETQRVKECMQGSSGIGLIWSGGRWDPARSIPFEMLRPLLGHGRLWNLQGGGGQSEGTGLWDVRDCCSDGLLTLAGTIANLRLVITVDTLAAHLAGAMGKPVWVLLQKEADWRWLAEGGTSPWYPTMRLFRQDRRGDWADVIERVCKELA